MKGIADSTRPAYSTTQCRYLAFCSNFEIHLYPSQSTHFVSSPPTLLTRDYRPHHLRLPIRPPLPPISSGLQAPAFSSWPWLHYVTWGIKRLQTPKNSIRLPITLSSCENSALGSSLHGLVWLSQAGRGLPFRWKSCYTSPTVQPGDSHLDPILVWMTKNDP